MAEPTVAHLSIGEVLGLLLAEFPDVTISKIRFLESQGLIEPERTPSGYRKFYDADVELLRLILREQREHFLPLRVIKDRIDSGQIEPSGEVVANHPAARSSPVQRQSGVTPAPPPSSSHPVHRSSPPPNQAEIELSPTPASMPRPPAAAMPAERTPAPAPANTAPAPASTASPPSPAPTTPAPAATTAPPEPAASSPRLLPGVLVSRDELCAMAQITASQLAQLEEYGVIAKRRGASELYGDEAVEVAAAAGGFLRAGVEARHLRAWRTSVEREAGLFEQLVMPVLRARHPEARSQATARLDELSALGAKLRGALMRSALRQVIEP